MSLANKQLEDIIGKLKRTLKEAISKTAMQEVGNFTASLIVKRTRLGYGVTNFTEGKKLLAPLKASTVKRRSMFAGLDGTTRPGKSNLTMTGQMLRSMRARVEGTGAVVIEPTGERSGNAKNKPTNYQVAQFAHDGAPGRRPRIFNRISKAEFNQVKRFYRKTFGDLLRLRKLIT
jgi:hypothetical protein